MEIVLENDRISAEENSKTVRSESIKNITRIIEVDTGSYVTSNDYDFYIFEINNEFWVSDANYIHELENWCSKHKIQYEAKYLDYPPKAFWKKWFFIKYASVVTGIYDKQLVTEIK
ncbi:MAG: hypothetical protein GY707_07890 [Desulfobacteraceae bacterium]|nr:hypothetical protein [Desulfobacteraceae bacterium]